MKSTTDLNKAYGNAQREYQVALERLRDANEAKRRAEKARDDAYKAWRRRIAIDHSSRDPDD